MKYLSFILTISFVLACSKNPEPSPGPVPKQLNFVSQGKVKIEGTLKSGAKMTASEMKKYFDVAVNLLDK